MTSKFIYKMLPYFICVVAGTFFFIAGKEINGDLKGLIHGIAGAFLSIPVLYLIYQLSHDFSEKKLNKELFDYAKMQIDREILSIVNQLSKVIQPYDKHDFSFKGISNFLSQNQNQVRDLLENSEYIGFQVFKNWSISVKNIHGILENPFILQRLENDQSISLISLLKELSVFESAQKEVKKLYDVIDTKVQGYQIQGGKDINPSNTEYPNRFLLLRHLKEDKYLVVDFGDFEQYQLDKLLNICKLNQQYLEPYSASIFSLIAKINKWISLTGKEFLLDTKMFRVAAPQS